jgi:hypothetical protein
VKKAAIALMIFLFAALGNVFGQAPTQPTLPQKTVSLTLPTQGTSTCPTLTTGSNCIRNAPSGNATSFQNAINSSTCGDTIVLAAGSTYSGNFTIPQTSCSGWIVIESSALGSLPSSGNRISPSNASNMAIISTPNTVPAIAILPNANHWRFIGLKITTSYVSTTNTVYNLVLSGYLSDDATNISSLPQMPSYLIFDRCYIVGLSTANVTRGILMDSYYMGIVDSYCDEIHNNANDSQCFASFNGPGPYLIQNNFIQASCENIMFGGADPAITNLVPSDITIIGNLIQKNTAWEGESAPYNWGVKNLMELKNAQRVLIDGNVFQYDWVSGQSYAMLIRSADQSGGCSWCVAQDVTVTHNLMQHIPGAMQIATYAGNAVAVPTQRVLLRNNLILDSNSVTWGNGTLFGISPDNVLLGHDWIIDHNTGFSNYTFLNFASAPGQTVNNFQFTNNIGDYGIYGMFGSGKGSGTAALTTYAPSAVYNDIVYIAVAGNKDGTTYPAGSSFATTFASVDFTGYLGTDPNLSGNFQLTSSSPYYRAGTDGNDIGVWDWTCLNNDSAAALAGKFVPNSGGCALSVDLMLQPPTNLNADVQ